MKLKLLLAGLLFPLAVFGANTNMWDNGWFTSSIRITSGTPAAGKVLVSDASGFGTWTVVASGTGNAMTNVAGVTGGVQGWSITNTFNAPEFFSGAGLLPPLQWPDFNPRAGEFPMVVVGPSVFGDNATLLIGSTNGTIFRGSNDFFAFAQLAGNATLSTFGGAFKVNNPTAAMSIGGNGGSSSIGHTTQLDTYTLNGIWTFATNVVVNGDATFGDSAGHTVTMNSSTMAIPNGWNVGSGRLTMPVTGAGSGTNYIGFPFVVGAVGSGPRLLITTNTAGFILLTNLNGTGSIILQ